MINISDNNIIKIYNKEALEKANNYLDNNSKEDILKETQKATTILSTAFSIILMVSIISIMYIVNITENSDVKLVCFVVSICVAIIFILLSITIYLKINYKKEEKLYNIALCEIYLENVAEIGKINNATIDKSKGKWYITYKDAFGCNITKEIEEITYNEIIGDTKCEIYVTESNDNRSSIKFKLTANKEDNLLFNKQYNKGEYSY